MIVTIPAECTKLCEDLSGGALARLNEALTSTEHVVGSLSDATGIGRVTLLAVLDMSAQAGAVDLGVMVTCRDGEVRHFPLGGGVVRAFGAEIPEDGTSYDVTATVREPFTVRVDRGER